MSMLTTEQREAVRKLMKKDLVRHNHPIYFNDALPYVEDEDYNSDAWEDNGRPLIVALIKEYVVVRHNAKFITFFEKGYGGIGVISIKDDEVKDVLFTPGKILTFHDVDDEYTILDDEYYFGGEQGVRLYKQVK